MASVKVNTTQSIKDVTLTLTTTEAALLVFILGRNTGYDNEISQASSDLYAALSNTLIYGDVNLPKRVEPKDYYGGDGVTLDTDRLHLV